MSYVCLNKEIIILLIIVIGIGSYYFHNLLIKNNNINKDLYERVDDLENKESFNSSVIIDNNYGNTINRTPQQINSLDRVYNPLRYPYKSSAYYSQNWRPNLALPPQVVGCGGRNLPCLGGTQVAISNPTIPLNINNNNIAPINIRTRGPLGQPQQVGTIYRLYSHGNEVLPLYGRKKYPNGSDNWEYYTIAGRHDVKLPILTRRKGIELGTNDIVFIRGYNRKPYRVTMYEHDFPQYVPYL